MLRRLRRQAPDDDAATLSAALVRRVVEGVVSQARAEGLQDAEDAAAAPAVATAALATTRQRQPALSPPLLERCEVSGERLHVAWRQPDGGEAAEWVVEWRGAAWWWPQRQRTQKPYLVASVAVPYLAAGGAVPLSVRVFATSGRRKSAWTPWLVACQLAPVRVRLWLRERVRLRLGLRRALTLSRACACARAYARRARASPGWLCT